VLTEDGWLHTGDIATMDEDGYFYIVDRKKDLIISGGYNVYPRDIDEVFYEHPKVQEACSVGIPHDKRGEAVKTFVVLKEGETADAEELMAYCREHLAKYKWPVEIEFRDELPKTNVGKILRKDLRAEELAKRGQGQRG
jgi:long-chain acyl-CoA synthetase